MVNAVTDKYEKTLFAYWILNNENTIMTMKNILVTGGAGFIGSNLIKRLFNDLRGATIVNIDNMNAYYDVSLKDYRLAQLKVESEKLKVDYHFVKGDIADKALIDKLFAEHKFDSVVNLAAQAGVRYSIEKP